MPTGPGREPSAPRCPGATGRAARVRSVAVSLRRLAIGRARRLLMPCVALSASSVVARCVLVSWRPSVACRPFRPSAACACPWPAFGGLACGPCPAFGGLSALAVAVPALGGLSGGQARPWDVCRRSPWGVSRAVAVVAVTRGPSGRVGVRAAAVGGGGGGGGGGWRAEAAARRRRRCRWFGVDGLRTEDHRDDGRLGRSASASAVGVGVGSVEGVGTVLGSGDSEAPGSIDGGRARRAGRRDGLARWARSRLRRLAARRRRRNR